MIFSIEYYLRDIICKCFYRFSLELVLFQKHSKLFMNEFTYKNHLCLYIYYDFKTFRIHLHPQHYNIQILGLIHSCMYMNVWIYNIYIHFLIYRKQLVHVRHVFIFKNVYILWPCTHAGAESWVSPI